MFDFSGQTVMITGAGAGIGYGFAEAFHGAGANVVLGDVRQEALDRSVSKLGSSGRVFAQTVDVRDVGSVQAWVAAGEERFGPMTIMIANAGIYPTALVVDMDVEEWDRVIETNVRGTFLTCQAAARSMQANNTQGKIITLASGSANSGRRGASHYCASKAGVVMFTKVLALELAGDRINVNCISPGLVEVEGEVSPLTAEYVEALSSTIPWGRVGQPQDIANAALFLASPYADFITGEVLAVNGGTSAGRANLPLSTPQ